jgi:hypothetical protein
MAGPPRESPGRVELPEDARRLPRAPPPRPRRRRASGFPKKRDPDETPAGIRIKGLL